MSTIAPWTDGDVVQTQIPYDDFPITVVREGGAWRAINGTAEGVTDAEIDEWVADGAAVEKIRQ
jgi:hypothetical protein